MTSNSLKHAVISLYRYGNAYDFISFGNEPLVFMIMNTCISVNKYDIIFINNKTYTCA